MEPLFYKVLISQSGVGVPTANVLRNTLGGEVEITRIGQGVYQGTLLGAFPHDKTFLTPQRYVSIVDRYEIVAQVGYGDVFTLTITDSDGVPTDQGLDNFPLAIEVYP